MRELRRKLKSVNSKDDFYDLYVAFDNMEGKIRFQYLRYFIGTFTLLLINFLPAIRSYISSFSANSLQLFSSCFMALILFLYFYNKKREFYFKNEYRNVDKEFLKKLGEFLGFITMKEWLEKEEDKNAEPRFYRPSGYKWVDFESDFAVTPMLVEKNNNREVSIDDVIKDMATKPIFIAGEPGSGKSTVLKYIGYKLLKNEKKPFLEIYVILLKEKSCKIEPRDVNILVEKNIVLFVDDVHLDDYKTLLMIRKKAKNNIIFSGRILSSRVEKVTTYREEEIKKIQNLVDYIVKPEEMTEKVIDRFCEKYDLSFSENEMESLRKQKNLMLLSIQLMGREQSLEGSSGILSPEEAIARYTGDNGYLERIYKRYHSDKNLEYNRECVVNLLVSIALLYVFEIPIRREFLENLFGDCNHYLEFLLRIKEIQVINVSVEPGEYVEYIHLYHSSLAETIIGTLDKIDSFGKRFKQMFGGDISLFYWEYIKKYPGDSLDLMIMLPDNIFEKLQEKKEFFKVFEMVLKNTKKLPYLFRIYLERGKPKLFRTINLKVYETMVVNLEDSEDIRELILGLYNIGYKIKKIKDKLFEYRIKYFKNPGDIAVLLMTLNDISYDIEWIRKIESKYFENRIKQWDNPGDISDLLFALHSIGYDMDWVKRIESKHFEYRIRHWNNPWDIGNLLSALHMVGYDIDWVKRIDSGYFEKRIENWDNSWDIATLLTALHKVGYNMSRLSNSVFMKKVEEWDNPKDIGNLLSALHMVGYDIDWVKRIDSGYFEKRIENWDNSWDIATLLTALHKVGYNMSRLSNSVFMKKVEEWDNPWDVVSIATLLSTLHEVRYNMEWVKRIDSKYFEKRIENVDHPWAIATLLTALHEVGYDMDWLKGINSKFFEDKIREMDGSWGIDELLLILHRIGYNINKLSPEVFEEKIEEWDDPNDIGNLLSALHEVGYDMEWVKRIDSGYFEKRIENVDHPWAIATLLTALHKVGYDMDWVKKIDFEKKMENRITPWYYIDEIKKLLYALFNVGYNINNLSMDIFKEMVEEWDDPNDIGNLLSALHEVGYDMDWVKRMEPEVFREKIEGVYSKFPDKWRDSVKLLFEALNKIGYDTNRINFDKK